MNNTPQPFLISLKDFNKTVGKGKKVTFNLDRNTIKLYYPEESVKRNETKYIIIIIVCIAIWLLILQVLEVLD